MSAHEPFRSKSVVNTTRQSRGVARRACNALSNRENNRGSFKSLVILVYRGGIRITVQIAADSEMGLLVAGEAGWPRPSEGDSSKTVQRQMLWVAHSGPCLMNPKQWDPVIRPGIVLRIKEMQYQRRQRQHVRSRLIAIDSLRMGRNEYQRTL